MKYHNPVLRNSTLDAIEAQGGEGFDVARVKSKRVSNDTYAYFFGGVLKTAMQFEKFGGWEEDDIRYEYEMMFLAEEKMMIIRNSEGVEVGRKVVKKHRSISDCNQKEVNEFIEKVIADLAMNGIVVLTPEQYYLEKHKTITKTNGSDTE